MIPNPDNETGDPSRPYTIEPMAADLLNRITSPRSPGVCILSAYVHTLGALAVAENAGEHPTALYHLRNAAAALERAHRALTSTDGTAILQDGEAEPADTWSTPNPWPPAAAHHTEPRQR